MRSKQKRDDCDKHHRFSRKDRQFEDRVEVCDIRLRIGVKGVEDRLRSDVNGGFEWNAAFWREWSLVIANNPM